MFGLFTSTMAMLLVTIHYQDGVEVIPRPFRGHSEVIMNDLLLRISFMVIHNLFFANPQKPKDII